MLFSVINQWSGPPLPPPKDLNPMNNNNKGNGWEEPSPTDHRRNLLNYDDGTSLWGNTQTRPNVPGGKTSKLLVYNNIFVFLNLKK